MKTGIIFDMDGLIVDTERLFVNTWCEILTERGFPPHREEAVHCIGLAHNLTFSYMQEQLGLDFPCMEIMREVARRTDRIYHESGVPVKPGLYTLLDFLDENGIPYAVATSTKAAAADFRLRTISVRDRLAALVTGDMVEHGKPEPDIFLLAAAQLGIPPENCYVLEDSIAGIHAAHRAGCRPVMIPDLKQPDEETIGLCCAVLQNLTDMLPLLRKLPECNGEA